MLIEYLLNQSETPLQRIDLDRSENGDILFSHDSGVFLNYSLFGFYSSSILRNLFVPKALYVMLILRH